MSFYQALHQLKKTKELDTDMLAALGVSFESFIRYAQHPRPVRERMIEGLISRLEGKR